MIVHIKCRPIGVRGIDTSQIRVENRGGDGNNHAGKAEDDSKAKVVLKPLFFCDRIRQGLGKHFRIDDTALLDLLEQDLLFSSQDVPAVEIVEHDGQQDHCSRNQVHEKGNKTKNCIHV